MSLKPDKGNPSDIQSEKQGAWFVHAALQRYAQEVPEAANNTYYQEAMQEAAAGYAASMS